MLLVHCSGPGEDEDKKEKDSTEEFQDDIFDSVGYDEVEDEGEDDQEEE